MVVGVLLREGSSEMKRNVYSTSFRSAVSQVTGVDPGFSLGKGFIGDAVLAIEGVSSLL